MKKYLALCLIVLSSGVYAQNRKGITKLGSLTYSQNLNDVWGYADSVGNEYALVGVKNGLSIVDVTNPATPIEKQFISGGSSIWRDIKTWSHYAYVMHDGLSSGTSDGLLIVDMDSVNQANPKFVKRFPLVREDTTFFVVQRSHNLYIDEKGYLYMFGANTPAGGALIFDLNADPENPAFIGNYDTHYLHDGVVRGDTLWGGAIINGTLRWVNIRNRANPVDVTSIATPFTFTHNVWFSDNNKYVFTTDERSGASIASYDVTDSTNITYLDEVRTSYGGSDVIPHNTHVLNDFLVTSYYTSGLQIVDASNPDILVETAYYDTSPLTGDGYNGAWGAYPYLPSGNILVTDIEQGLFVLNSSYPRASFLRGLVKDSATQVGIPNANVRILSGGLNESVDIFGFFNFGQADTGIFQIEASKSGYLTDTFDVEFKAGQTLVKEFPLRTFDFAVGESEQLVSDIYPNPTANGQFEISIAESLRKNIQVEIYSIDGAKVFCLFEQTVTSNLIINSDLSPGVYILKVNHAGIEISTQKLKID